MSILGPSWYKNSSGEGNEFTCTHLFSGRTMMVNAIPKEAWLENPAYIYFQTYGDFGGGDVGIWANSNGSNTGFVRQLSPAIIKRGTMVITTNQTAVKDVGFTVHIVRGGASTNKASSGIRRVRTLYDVLPVTDTEYKTQYFKENINLNLYAGETYGYEFRIKDPVPTLPTGTFITITTSCIMTLDVEFGGGGI